MIVTEHLSYLPRGISVGHVHGGRSYLGLPTQQSSLGDLLTKLEDVSHTMGTPPLPMMVLVVASLLLLAPRQTGHSAQQPRGQTSSP